jgi:hypothetical protein
MASNSRMNLWMVSKLAERNALTSADGLYPGDFCLVAGTSMYTYAPTSVWLPHGGLALTGPVSLGARNTNTAVLQTLFVMTSVTFREIPAVTPMPSSFTLTPVANGLWPTTPNLVAINGTGFTVSGTSANVPAGGQAFFRGTYTVL